MDNAMAEDLETQLRKRELYASMLGWEIMRSIVYGETVSFYEADTSTPQNRVVTVRAGESTFNVDLNAMQGDKSVSATLAIGLMRARQEPKNPALVFIKEKIDRDIAAVKRVT